MDVANPKELKLIGEYNPNSDYFNIISFLDIALSKDEKTLFAIDGNSLSIIDVSNPKKPKLLKKIDLKNVEKLYISNDGKRLYGLLNKLLSFNNVENGLVILDITDKNNPVQKSKYPIDNTIIYNMAISKDNSIATLATLQGLIVLDVKNPNNIFEKGKYKSLIYDVAMASNKKVFVIDSQKIAVSILDMTNPANPKEINSIKDIGVPYKIFLSNDETKLFVATFDKNTNNTNTKIYIFDVSSYTK